MVILSTGVGWLAASRVKSPAQLAAQTAPPEASLITHPVEKRVLSADLIVRGTMRYSNPISVVLPPSVLRPPPVLVSVPPVKGSPLNEGDVVMIVSGRPVFAMKGAAPGYRDLGPGTEGNDVQQLEEALERSGLKPGAVDGRFDGATATAVAAWYERAGFAPFGPNEQQRVSLRQGQTAVSQASDRMLQARQASLVNRTGAKPAEFVDANTAIQAAVDGIETAQGAAERDASRGDADVALKEADVNAKEADVATKEAAVQSAVLASEDARRRSELTNQGRNAATGLSVAVGQVALLRDAVADASGASAAAQADAAASEAVLNGVQKTGEAVVADAQSKLAAVSSINVEGLTIQQVQDAYAAFRSAQTALLAAQATAAKDNSVSAADLTAKKNALAAADLKSSQAQRRLESALAGVDPTTGLPIVTPGDEAGIRLAVKQSELVLQQAQLMLPPARRALAASQGDLEAVRRARDLGAAANARAIKSARSQLTSARAKLKALSTPGVGAATLAEAVRVAEAELDRLKDDLKKLASTIGVQVPANEIVFFSSLPLRIDDTKIKRGDSATTEVMTVSGTSLAIDSSLLATEASLTKVDAVALIEAADFGYSSAGRISFIADKPGLRGTDAQHIAIEVTPDEAPTQLVGASVRITIPTRTTNGEALVVPLSALSVRADGSTQLQIEDRPGSVRTAVVTAGLSAQGYVEIVIVSGRVAAGDRVVIGTKGPSSASTGPAPNDPVSSSTITSGTSPPTIGTDASAVATTNAP